jgi:peptidoglycan L-alanyl-D-glutamate endopeptidase CwlK
MSYTLGKRSKKNLLGVHPDLYAVVKRAISFTNQDFTVIEGLRTIERQKELVRKGFSKTMNSRHITGHAVDVVPYPIAHRLSYPDYQWDNVADAMLDAASDLKVDLEWGYAKWGWDKPHYQLSWRSYK